MAKFGWFCSPILSFPLSTDTLPSPPCPSDRVFSTPQHVFSHTHTHTHAHTPTLAHLDDRPRLQEKPIKHTQIYSLSASSFSVSFDLVMFLQFGWRKTKKKEGKKKKRNPPRHLLCVNILLSFFLSFFFFSKQFPPPTPQIFFSFFLQSHSLEIPYLYGYCYYYNYYNLSVQSLKERTLFWKAVPSLPSLRNPFGRWNQVSWKTAGVKRIDSLWLFHFYTHLHFHDCCRTHTQTHIQRLTGSLNHKQQYASVPTPSNGPQPHATCSFYSGINRVGSQFSSQVCCVVYLVHVLVPYLIWLSATLIFYLGSSMP